MEKMPVLIPSAHIRIRQYRGEGDPMRFARCFQDAWQSIPLTARRTLLKYWRDCTEQFEPEFAPYPKVYVQRYWSLWDRRHKTGCFGMCNHGGNSIFFWSPAVVLMPDEVLSALIRHELGHCYLHAKLGGDVRHKETAVTEGVLPDWGYQEEEWLLDVWINNNRAENKIGRRRTRKHLWQTVMPV